MIPLRLLVIGVALALPGASACTARSTPTQRVVYPEYPERPNVPPPVAESDPNGSPAHHRIDLPASDAAGN